jgi:hypothetical protein
MVRFIVIQLSYPDLNSRFDMIVKLVTYFVNYKIKSTQFFKYTYKNRVYVYIFIEKILIHI